LVRKPEGKTPLGRSESKWKNKIKKGTERNRIGEVLIGFNWLMIETSG
jgi:hypothetical protein